MTPTEKNARLNLLHEAAVRLIADGRCCAHIDREIARLSAANDRLPLPANDTAEDIPA